MSSSSATLASEDRAPWIAAVADFWELTKPRIVAMEVITIAMGFYLGTRGEWSLAVLGATLIGTGLVAGSASALNMWLEAQLDAQMTRTQDRPIPAGRLQPWQAVVFAVVLLVLGSVLLYVGPGLVTLGLGLLCWFLYVVVYTPLKVRSTFNTAVGAASGAIPILIGYVAAGGGFDWVALGLFGVLYLWQYPHFMAIAWRCRDDYQAAGYVMSTTVDPTGKRAGVEAIVGSLLLAPVSLLPLAMASSVVWGGFYAVWALLLVAVYLHASVKFARQRNDATSRRLLRVSLLYLPCWILGLLLVAF